MKFLICDILIRYFLIINGNTFFLICITYGVRKMRAILLILLISSLVFCPSLENTSTYLSDTKPLVVTTTSVLASIVKDIAGDLVDVKYLVSPSMCPGHYDVKPGDIETIRSASLILAHGMEWAGWLRELINSANQTGDLKVPIFNVTGPWNTPPLLKQKYTTVANLLIQTLGIDVESRLSRCLESIDTVDAELKEIANEYGFNNTPVVVMQWQMAFIKYLGFKIVASYGPPEFVSTQDIIEIEKNATLYGARLVIDNLHSGVELGERIAKDVGAVHVVLLNFPEAVPGIKNVTDMMLYNAKILANALSEYEVHNKVSALQEEISLWRSISIAALVIIIIESIVLVALVRRK